MSAVVVSRKLAVKHRLAKNTGAKASAAARAYRSQGGSMSSADGGSSQPIASETNSATYNGAGLRRGSTDATPIDASTDSRIAKNTRAFTTHVLPNSSANETMLRVSSSRNAAPSRKKWGLKRRIDSPTQRVLANTDHDRDPEDHGEGREQRRGDRRLPEVEEGPGVRGHRRGRVRLHDLRACGHAERPGQARPVGEHGRVERAAPVAGDDRRPPEGVLEHAAEPVREPRAPVEVVEHHDPVGRQVGPDVVERLLGEQEGLEANVAGRRQQRERVRLRHHDQVVLLVRRAQERPPVVDDPRDARILVGAHPVSVDAELQDRRVDLDGVHMTIAARDGHRHVVARARADDQRVVERVVGVPIVDLRIEDAQRLVGHREPLVRDPVGVDDRRRHPSPTR